MDPSILERVEDLGDLELALLVSTVAQVHCIFSTAVDTVQNLQEELRLSCIDLFGAHPAVVQCTSRTTVDEFNEGLLIDNEDGPEDAGHGDDYTKARPSLMVNFTPIRQASPGGSRMGSIAKLEEKRIPEVIIAIGLDTAPESVQIQAFELLRSGRIFTRSAMHVAPKDLLFITVLSNPAARLTRHLNDCFCVSHFHNPDEGLPHLDNHFNSKYFAPPTFSAADIKVLTELTHSVEMTAEIAQYLHNVVVFMRNSRYVKAGVTATATRQLRILAMALAPLHGLDYVPPSLIALAARKIYPHRLVLATPENEKSLLWGSDPRAIEQLLEGVTIEDVIEDVLASLDTPL
ncbi:hypothetical protein CERZMDRAFT_81519 [Cercospora zeae-maydis SCOH1-5]|uniref:magnesium chelatase n=1 Tax=Cercospora zeae-maydis SCOH1-5 TaxID=717836 RepID=A0A6A6FSY5_9PEZI|nr:hypothetical protein CERZMDRAFT_81519 [Cercospora zeae-maydis SCOH1-5]